MVSMGPSRDGLPCCEQFTCRSPGDRLARVHPLRGTSSVTWLLAMHPAEDHFRAAGGNGQQQWASSLVKKGLDTAEQSAWSPVSRFGIGIVMQSTTTLLYSHFVSFINPLVPNVLNLGHFTKISIKNGSSKNFHMSVAPMIR